MRLPQSIDTRDVGLMNFQVLEKVCLGTYGVAQGRSCPMHSDGRHVSGRQLSRSKCRGDEGVLGWPIRRSQRR